MLETTHALIAGSIAIKISNPVAAPLLGLFSHYLLDSFPHWDLGTDWRTRPKTATGVYAIADTLIGFTLAYFLFHAKVQINHLFLTVFFSMLPDFLEAPWYIFFANLYKKKPSSKANFFEKFVYRVYSYQALFHNKAPFPVGLLTQGLAVVFFWIILSR